MIAKDSSPQAVPFEITDLSWATHSTRLDCSIDHQLFYHNSLAVPVIIVFRSGIAITVPVSTSYNTMRNKFIVRSSWKSTRSVLVDMVESSNEVLDDGWNSEHQMVREAIIDNSCGGSGRGRPIDYALKMSDFKNNLGNLYLTQFDIVVSIKEHDEVAIHPYSDKSKRSMLLSNDDGIMGKERFQYGVSVVDKQKRFGRRFINISGEVFAIDPMTTSELDDGVYLKTSGPISSSGFSGDPRCMWLSFEQAKEKLGLYTSVEEAVTMGNPKAVEEREQRELQGASKRQEHEMRMRQRDREEELAAMKHIEEMRLAQVRDTEARLQSEQALLEHHMLLEKLRRKDHYEDNDATRKSSLELIKYVPALLAAVGAIWIMAKKKQT
jgi:hypothetical protein